MGSFGGTKGIALAAAGVALLASACSGTEATATDAQPVAETEECFLGLDLWDTDLALTWIADGKVW